jgi:hypothetical protein
MACRYGPIKAEYDTSRRTISRSNYEVDFVAVYNKLASLGCKIYEEMYIHPVTVQVRRL